MHTFTDLSRTLNRPGIYLHGLQKRFELPEFEGADYSDAYLALLQTVVLAMHFSPPTQWVVVRATVCRRARRCRDGDR